MKLLNIDKMETLESEEYKLEEIKKFETNNVGAIVIKTYSYYANKEDPLEELEEDYKKFMQLPYVIRMVSNDKSLQLFGYINSDRYKSMRSVFLKTDIKDADPIRDMNILYTPHSLTESNIDGIIEEGTGTLDSYIEAINNTDDLVEVAYYTYSSLKTINESHAISHIENLTDIISREKLSNLNPLCEARINSGVITPYLTPDEILDQVDIKEENEWFNNYRAKCIGLKPTMENYYRYYTSTVNSLLLEMDKNPTQEIKDHLLELGYLPFITNDTQNTRVDNLISYDTDKFKFHDLTKTGSDDSSFSLTDTTVPGITLFLIDGELETNDKYNIIPNVIISLDPSSEQYYALHCGDIKKSIGSLEDILSKYSKNSIVSMLFLPVSFEYINKIKKHIENMTSSISSVECNFIRDICKAISSDNPRIGNIKLFCYNIFNSILLFKNSHKDIIIDPNKFIDTDKDIHIYYLYNGSISNFNKENQYSKISSIVKLSEMYNIDETVIDEGFLPYMKLQVLLEYQELPIEFDKDGNIFIKKKEKIDFAAEYQACHRLLMQYAKVKNYEAMKYYVAKLWYMNILIEKRLYTKNRTKQIEERLPYYYKTRAHILSDFNKYIAEILENDPEFDFREYYKTTPFDKSILKVSKGFLKTIWDYLTKLLSLFKI